MEIVMVGYAGRAGAAALAKTHAAILSEEFAPDLIAAASEGPASFRLPEDIGAQCLVSLAGGFYRGLRILAEKLQCGCEVDMRRIPVRQEDVEICEILGKDIFRICSSGGWLAACDTAEETVARLRRAQIPASRIGRTISGRGDYSTVST